MWPRMHASCGLASVWCGFTAQITALKKPSALNRAADPPISILEGPARRRLGQNYADTKTMFVIVGWVLALGCIFGVYIVHGGNIGVILHALPFEMITIFGAAIGAFLANNQMKVVKSSLKGLGQCFKGSKFSKARYMELLALLYDILQKARKEGLMSIEKDVEEPHSSPLFQKYPTVGNDHHVTEFITDYLRMMVSGNLNAHEIESLMDNEIDTPHADEHAAVAAIARRAGGLPAFGIVAAVLGVVNTMGSISLSIRLSISWAFRLPETIMRK